jgi:hypothetical protein
MFKPGPNQNGKSSAPSAFSLGLGFVLAVWLAAMPALAQQGRQLEGIDVQQLNGQRLELRLRMTSIRRASQSTCLPRPWRWMSRGRTSTSARSRAFWQPKPTGGRALS